MANSTNEENLKGDNTTTRVSPAISFLKALRDLTILMVTLTIIAGVTFTLWPATLTAIANVSFVLPLINFSVDFAFMNSIGLPIATAIAGAAATTALALSYSMLRLFSALVSLGASAKPSDINDKSNDSDAINSDDENEDDENQRQLEAEEAKALYIRQVQELTNFIKYKVEQEGIVDFNTLMNEVYENCFGHEQTGLIAASEIDNLVTTMLKEHLSQNRQTPSPQPQDDNLAKRQEEERLKAEQAKAEKARVRAEEERKAEEARLKAEANKKASENSSDINSEAKGDSSLPLSEMMKNLGSPLTQAENEADKKQRQDIAANDSDGNETKPSSSPVNV